MEKYSVKNIRPFGVAKKNCFRICQFGPISRYFEVFRISRAS